MGRADGSAIHWRGALQAGIAIGAGVLTIGCFATGVCETALTGVLIVGGIGAAAGVGTYYAGGGHHTAIGAVKAGLFGFGVGALAGLATAAYAAVGVASLAEAALPLVGMHVVGGLYGVGAYMVQTPARDRNLRDGLINFGGGVVNVAPLPAEWFGFGEH